jgi:hypothetical protein
MKDAPLPHNKDMVKPIQAWPRVEHDAVQSPAHYARLQPEPLDVIEAWKLDHHSACALKYIARAGHKGNRLEDLRKAAEYLRRLIALEERSSG